MSPTCSICLESFTSPVSLPCGHVFCRECIRRTVDAIKSCNMQHFCPACRAPYSILTIDLALIPSNLRPHILPPIRKVFFDDPSSPGASTSTSAASPPTSTSAPTATPSPAPPSADLTRAAAEVKALQQHCATWRRRAEVHAAANASLLGFARAAKDCALRLRAERDAERSRCVLLKRKLAELMLELDSETESIFTEPTRKHAGGAGAAAPRAGLPVFLMQCKPPEHFYDNPADMEHSHFGPPMKRRRESPRRESASATAPVPAATVVAAVPVPVPVPEAGPHVPAFSGSTLSSKRLPTLGAQ